MGRESSRLEMESSRLEMESSRLEMVLGPPTVSVKQLATHLPSCTLLRKTCKKRQMEKNSEELEKYVQDHSTLELDDAEADEVQIQPTIC